MENQFRRRYCNHFWALVYFGFDPLRCFRLVHPLIELHFANERVGMICEGAD